MAGFPTPWTDGEDAKLRALYYAHLSGGIPRISMARLALHFSLRTADQCHRRLIDLKVIPCYGHGAEANRTKRISLFYEADRDNAEYMMSCLCTVLGVTKITMDLLHLKYQELHKAGKITGISRDAKRCKLGLIKEMYLRLCETTPSMVTFDDVFQAH
jgi:hypothetical protein